MIDLCYEDMGVNEIYSLLGVREGAEAENLKKYVHELFEQEFINWKIVDNGSVFRRHTEKSCLDQEKIIHDMVELVRDIDRII
jgi:hypothetical protein